MKSGLRPHDVAIAVIILVVLYCVGQAFAGEQKLHELDDPVYVVTL